MCAVLYRCSLFLLQLVAVVLLYCISKTPSQKNRTLPKPLCHAGIAPLTLAKPLCHAERTMVLHCAASLRRRSGFTLCTTAAHNECEQRVNNSLTQSAQFAQRKCTMNAHNEHTMKKHSAHAQRAHNAHNANFCFNTMQYIYIHICVCAHTYVYIHI